MKAVEQYVDQASLKIKSWWKSGIIWLAGAMIAIEGLGVVLPLLGSAVDPRITGVLNTGIAIAIIWNRLFKTNQAVTISAAEKPVVADKEIPVPADSGLSGA